MEKRRVATALVGMSLVTSGLAVAAPAAAQDREIVLHQGHIDAFEVTWDGEQEQVRLLLKDDTYLHASEPVYRDPETVTIAVDGVEAAFTVPSPPPPGMDFLAPGSTQYLLPQNQHQQLPWPGWSTERLLGSLSGTGITPAGAQPVLLDVQVDGPGEVHSFMNGSFGEVINHYVGNTDVIPIAANAHVHTNWTFSAPGDYHLTVTPSLATTDGTLTGPAKEYHVRVDTDGSTEPPPVTQPPVATPNPPAPAPKRLTPHKSPKVKGKARVGRTLRVTPGKWRPRATRLVYRWKVGKKTVKRGQQAKHRRLKVRKKFRGKRITVTVVAKRPGARNGKVNVRTPRVKPR